MSEDRDAGDGRKVIAFVNPSIDGFSAGPDREMSWPIEHAIAAQLAGYCEGAWRGAIIAVMDRPTYEGFAQVWPPVARDGNGSPCNRHVALWLDRVEKVPVSRTLQDVTWHNTWIVADLEGGSARSKAPPTAIFSFPTVPGSPAHS